MGQRSTSATQLLTDVCIIGAGPAGLTTAGDLDQAGLSTVVVEAGSLGAGESVTTADSIGLPYPLSRSRKAGVGGSGHCWDIPSPLGGTVVRLRQLDPLDLAERPGLRPGWPLSSVDLEPWWTSAWSTFGLPPPEVVAEEGPLRKVFFGFGPADTFTERMPAQLAASPRVRLLTETAVIDIRTDEDGRTVSAVLCVGPDGPLEIVAREYVLAGGGIENARLLLASRSQHPEGLGNRTDQVGRCFMEHPHYASGLLVVDDAGDLLRRRAAWDVTVLDDQVRQPMLALDDEALIDHGLTTAAFYLVPRPASKPVSRTPEGGIDHRAVQAVHEVRMALLNKAWDLRVAHQLGHAMKASPALVTAAVQQAAALRSARRGRVSSAPVVFTVAAMSEQLPSADSRIRLSGARDRFGVPRALLDWRLAEPEFDDLRRRHDLVAPRLASIFGGTVLSLVHAVPKPHIGEGYHHMGTTRMSAAPDNGVVDRDCRVHGIHNLSVAGSSVFSSVGFGNPTLTVVALAHRLAHRIKATVGGVAQLSPGQLDGGRLTS